MNAVVNEAGRRVALGRLLNARMGAPVVILMMLAMVVIPLPPLVLDVLFTFNIALAIVVMLAAVYSERPLDLAIFPTVLLLATLLRLALNVASTRVVLINGHTGTDAAGQVIQAFGAFVIGGNYTVGFVVFAILVVINFVVVTKGAGRISEVSARFTLDAMPGKQMAIDADLNAGLLTQDEARERRTAIAAEADFYGAMDGASKFVKGDAVAGILILFINLLGGLAIGTLQHGMSLREASQDYALLTIGDGLVAQVPSLLLSTAAAIMVTRTSHPVDMGGQILAQLFQTPKTLYVTAGLMGTLGILPGMPNLAFLTLAGAAGAAGWFRSRPPSDSGTEVVAAEETATTASEDVSWEDVVPVDPLGLEVGYRLIGLVDPDQGGELLARIRGVRKKRTAELGFLVPAVHIRDSLDLEPTGYRITSHGVVVGEGEVIPGMELAIESGEPAGPIDGHPTQDPVFGLDAVWVEPHLREHAQALGYMVFNPGTVITTHLDRIIVEFAHELLGQSAVQQLLDRVAERAPKLVESLVPDPLPLSVVARVLQNLLHDRISLLQIQTIVETLAEHARASQDADVLTYRVRCALGRYIVQEINGLRSELQVIVLDPGLDHLLHRHLQASGQAQAALDPETLMQLDQAIADAAEECANQTEPTVLLVADELRGLVQSLARRHEPAPRVLAIGEVPDSQRIRSVARVGGGESFPSGTGGAAE